MNQIRINDGMMPMCHDLKWKALTSINSALLTLFTLNLKAFVS